MRTLGYRAICSCALLRFKESAEDGLACLDIRRRLRHVGCVLSSAEDQQLGTRVDACVVLALVMSERYDDAVKVASSLSCTSELAGPPASTSKPFGCAACGTQATTGEGNDTTAGSTECATVTAATWRSAVTHLQQFRSAVAAHQWREALATADAHPATVGACLRASPLCAMLAFVHLEAGHPMTARALLLTYLATLPEPPTWAALTSAPPEHAQLWDSYRSHYVFTTTLLAKASVMSGSAYLNIAAALLQRCLRVLPLYTPARLLAEFVLSYEAQKASLEAAMAKRDYSAALTVSARLLALPEMHPALQAEVYLARTHVQWLRRLPLEVVREASQCVAADPDCALAYRLRADALEAMQQGAEAVADRAAAMRYSSVKGSVEAAYAELQEQRKRLDAEQRAAEAQRRSFTAFAPSPGAAASYASGSESGEGVGAGGASPAHPPGGFAKSCGCDDKGDGAAAAAFPRPGSHSAAARRADGVSGNGARKNNGAPPSSSSSSFFSSLRYGATAEPSHYTVLGVPQHASQNDIRQRYRQLTLQCHPDRLVNASSERREQAAEEFKRVSNAYSVLSDAQQRSDYDATLHQRM